MRQWPLLRHVLCRQSWWVLTGLERLECWAYSWYLEPSHSTCVLAGFSCSRVDSKLSQASTSSRQPEKTVSNMWMRMRTDTHSELGNNPETDSYVHQIEGHRLTARCDHVMAFKMCFPLLSSTWPRTVPNAVGSVTLICAYVAVKVVDIVPTFPMITNFCFL